MRLVDAHCHLESEEFRDCLDAVLGDARAVGLVHFVTCAVVPEEWELGRDIARRYGDVAFAAGLHPWFVEEPTLGRLGELEQVCEQGAVAIGEIGLDGKIGVPMPLQQRAFERQLAIANSAMLPVVIHCRAAFGELMHCFKQTGPPKAGGIVHAFSGSVENAEELTGLGLDFSMGGALSYRNSHKRAAVLERIYPDHLLLETDSPDMPPVQVKEKPNVPANILYNLRGAAETLSESAETVAEVTTKNAARVFGLALT